MKRYSKNIYRVIEESICTPLREMTERNAHTEAVVFLAEWMTERDGRLETTREAVRLLNWARFIQSEHNKIGHLPYALCMFRSAVLEDILRQHGKFWDSPKVMRMIRESL